MYGCMNVYHVFVFGAVEGLVAFVQQHMFETTVGILVLGFGLELRRERAEHDGVFGSDDLAVFGGIDRVVYIRPELIESCSFAAGDGAEEMVFLSYGQDR